jgi:hypothetical protein
VAFWQEDLKIKTPFTEEETDKLLSFIGYGTLSAPIWFVGWEEGGGGEANLHTRLRFEPAMDLGTAQRALGYADYFDPPRPKIQPTWSVLIKIILGPIGREADPQTVRRYQAIRLEAVNGDTLLAELLPLPGPSINKWIYWDLFADPRLRNRKTYERSVLPHRTRLLRDLIQSHCPRLVIAYGKGRWPEFKNLFP